MVHIGMIKSGLQKIRRWWQIRTGRFDTPFDGEVPFWVFSLCLQLVVLACLAKILLPEFDFRNKVVFVSDQDEFVDIADQPENEIQFNEYDLSQLDNQSEVQLEIEAAEDISLVDLDDVVPVSIDVVPSDIGTDILAESTTFESTEILTSVHSTGSVGNVVAKASGAVDRMTQEIRESLEDNATIVVWLFDQSASLERQREEIVSRVDRIYRELNLLEESDDVAFKSHEDIPLLTQVYAFGQNVFQVLKEPTSDVAKIRSAINGIKRDTSGVENVFGAVLRCVKDLNDYRKIDRSTGQRKRNVMLVVLSDEAGDDGQRTDEAIRVCEKFAIPVYVIGVPAPFGRAESRVKWVDPDPRFDQRPQIAMVSQGPESLMPERLRLNFVGGNFSDLEMIDSGFGPFNLTRLCYRSGGTYFAVHPNRRNGRVNYWETSVYSSDFRYFFDPEIMKNYRPEYVSFSEYKKRVNNNQARMSLVQAAQIPSVNQLLAPQFRFEKSNEAAFVRSVGQAQQASAVLQPRLDRLYTILKEGEKDRDKEASPRWQAGFDLAIGRVIAAMLRSKSYNEMLALAKTKLSFKDPKNNTWELRPSRDLSSTGSMNEKLADKANMYLERVINNHPETPWALLAKRELSTPFGWKWRESFTPPPQPRPQRQANNNGNRRNPQPRQNRNPKQLRPVPKL